MSDPSTSRSVAQAGRPGNSAAPVVILSPVLFSSAIALLKDGTVRVWGSPADLGNGPPTVGGQASDVPVQVSGLRTGVANGPSTPLGSWAGRTRPSWPPAGPAGGSTEASTYDGGGKIRQFIDGRKRPRLPLHLDPDRRPDPGRRSGPGERVGMVVPAVEVGADFGVQFPGGAVGGLAFGAGGPAPAARTAKSSFASSSPPGGARMVSIMDGWGGTRGVNLGGLLDGRDGVYPGWELRPEHLDVIAGAGFDCVRLPVRWWGHGPGAFDDAVRSVVDLAVERDLAVVLSMHHADGLMAGEPGASQRLTQLWERISLQYRGVPRLAFDLVNEPRDALTPGKWNQLLPQVLAAVRAQDATRTVIAGGARMNTVEGLLELALPKDPHLVLSVHYYEPFVFTHQGAFWEKGAAAWVGTRWPGVQEHTDRLAVTGGLTRAADRARELGHGLVVAEFGAFERAPQADRAAWIGWVRAECERLGLGWIFWDFATDFGVFDREAGAWREDLRSALLPEAGAHSGVPRR